MSSKIFAKKLINWYLEHQRSLPWREKTDPYPIWLSEIILQQTRVQQGLPYYNKFILAFPTVFDLAKAPEQQVLSLWQGLGYYSRARNLHATAKYIVHELDGKFPDSYANLLKLKGIGPYTAAAIASFAYKEAVPVVDGNVFRVLARYFADSTDISSSSARKHFEQIAASLISIDQPDIFNQAIMEFGSLQCVPVQPDCPSCIFQSTCKGYLQEVVSDLPYKSKKTAKKDLYFHYLVFFTKDSILLKERTEKDIWKGLWDFPVIEHTSVLNEKQFLKKWKHSLQENIESYQTDYKQTLSHRQVYGQFALIPVKKSDMARIQKEFSGDWLPKLALSDLPKPVLINRFLKDAGI
jgi:A/G-specific adenine glycosylase